MAPKKVKRQGKRNNVKIKSKLSPRKRGLKIMKKAKASEKPLDKLQWLNKVPAETGVNRSETIPQWLNDCVYNKHVNRVPCSSSENSSVYDDNLPPDEIEEKSSSTDVSDECNCLHNKYPETTKGGILKHKISSTNSVVAKYIKSGMDHVASFIVESAIRFGEEHGVVVPDKNAPNTYEVMTPNKPYSDKSRKIRFKVPEKMLGYEDAKKVMWRSGGKSEGATAAASAAAAGAVAGSSRRSQPPESQTSSWSSKTDDSLEDILPLLEKLKDGGEIVSSDLDIEELARAKEADDHERKRSRMREKYRMMEKRYNSADDLSKGSDEREYEPEAKPVWKRFKRDSLELGRQRLRAATHSRQRQSTSPSPY